MPRSRPRVSVRYALREVGGMARRHHPGDLPARRGHKSQTCRSRVKRAYALTS